MDCGEYVYVAFTYSLDYECLDSCDSLNGCGVNAEIVIFAFVIIIICLLLACVSAINKRKQAERRAALDRNNQPVNQDVAGQPQPGRPPRETVVGQVYRDQ